MMEMIRILLESSLLFALLFAGVMLIRKIFHKKMSAFFQYTLWAVVILKLMIPVGVPVQASPWNALSGTLPSIQDEGITMRAAGDSVQTDSESGSPAAQQVAQNVQEAGTAEKAPAQTAPAAPQALEEPAIQLISTPQLLMVIWITGAGIMGAWLILGARRLKRDMYESAVSAPEWLQQEFADCKKALGIKRDIRLLMQEAVAVPCLMGAIRPRLAVPARLLSSRSQVRQILLHELIHFKHFDHIVNFLLNVLNAVYWFNPLVWVAFRQIRRDMESCCDESVLGRVGEEARQSYIETILSYAGKGDEPRYQVTMGFASPVKHMKKRIENMFATQKKTKKGIVAVALLLVATLGFACFTTACAPLTETIAKAADAELTASGEEKNGSLAEVIEIDGTAYRKKTGVMSILMLGIDWDGTQEKNATGARSDMIMLCTIDTQSGDIFFLSIPRDTRTAVHKVDVQTGAVQDEEYRTKLNHAYVLGGGQDGFGTQNVMRATQELLECDGQLDLPLQSYITIDLAHLPDLADAFGGVEVTLDQDVPGVGSAGETVRLSGENVRLYLQNRKQLEDGEMDRQRHEQTFMKALAKEMKQKGAARSAVQLFMQLKNGVIKSNLDMDQAMELMESLSQAPSVDDIKMETLTETENSWQVHDDPVMGMPIDYFVADEQELKARILELYYTPEQGGV